MRFLDGSLDSTLGLTNSTRVLPKQKKIISTQTKETSTWSTAKPAAESMFGKIDVKRVSKQMETNPLSRTEKPEAELEPKAHLWEIRREEHQEADEKSNIEYGRTRGGHEATNSKLD